MKKVTELEKDKSDMHDLLDQSNQVNLSNQQKIKMISDKYLVIIKQLKKELIDFRKVALDHISNVKHELKTAMVSQLQGALSLQMKRDELL